MAKKQVAIAHVCMGRGGSEARAMWGITALKDLFDVTLLTGFPIDLQRLNRQYGTSLEEGDFRVLTPSQCVMRWLGRTDAIRGSLFARWCRSVAPRFDVCISPYNPIDFGRPALQFIADLAFDNALRQQFDVAPPGVRGWAHRPGLAREAYLCFVKAIAGTSGSDPRDDLIVANSYWTAQVLRERRGMEIDRVLYPPVVAEAAESPWAEREPGFTCLGRISHEKRIEQIVEILSCIRDKGYDVHLHLIGPIGDDPYGQKVRRLCDDNRDWVIPEGSRVAGEKISLLARHRYAIHACPREAFGIAVAEMVKAGCIPFVPAESAPAEIVNEPALVYHSTEEAVDRIEAVLKNDAIQQSLRGRLSERATLFAIERFIAEFREIVMQFAAREENHD